MNPIKFVLALVALTVFAAIPVVVVADGDGDEDTSYYGNAMRPLIENGGSNIYGPGNARIARTGNNASHETFVNDHLLSARLRLGSASTTRDEYGPFGTPVGAIGLYTGHPYDAHQGLYFTPGRSQDPSLGRFLSPDLMRQGDNPYHYAGNNPIGYVDPGGNVLTPYFMESNTDPAYNYSMAHEVMSLFGAPARMRIVHDDTFRSKPGITSPRIDKLTSGASERLGQLLRGSVTDGAPRYTRTDEFYWIIGGNRDVELPDELVPVLNKWGEMQPGPRALSRIIILDFTGTGTGATNQGKLRTLERDSLVIEARATDIIFVDGKSGLRPSQFSVKVDGKTRKMGKSEFQTYVRDRIARKWGAGTPIEEIKPTRSKVLRSMDSPPPPKKTRAAGSLPPPLEIDPTSSYSTVSAEQRAFTGDTHGMFFGTYIPEDLFER